MNPKILWAAVAIVALLGLGYLASRVGNIGARGARSGTVAPTITLSSPLVPGVAVAVHWTTGLGQDTGPIVLKARSGRLETQIGRGEFGAGQAMVTIPCMFGGESVGVGLYGVSSEGEKLLAQQDAEVLSAGPDCLR